MGTRYYPEFLQLPASHPIAQAREAWCGLDSFTCHVALLDYDQDGTTTTSSSSTTTRTHRTQTPAAVTPP